MNKDITNYLKPRKIVAFLVLNTFD